MITLRVKKVKNLEKIIGLIGKKNPESLFFKTRFGIHTFGLKFPIDVLILDNKNRVISLKKSLKPNKIFFWNPLYNRVLELPQETINNKHIKFHEMIELTLI